MVKKAVSLLVALVMGASAAQAEGLMALYQAAQNNDPVFAAARAAREAGQEKRVQGQALLLPSLGFSVNAMQNHFESGPLSKDYSSHQWGVKLTQPLYRPANWAQAQQAERQSLLAEIQWQDAQQQLVLRVAKAYFDVLTARAALAAAEELRAAAQGQLKLAQASFEVGVVTIVDVHEAQSRFDLAEAQVLAARNQVAVAEEALAAIVGFVPQQYPRLKEGVRFAAPEPAAIEAWTETAREGNFAVLQARLALDIAREDVKRRRAAHLPSVDVVANYGQQRQLAQGTMPLTTRDVTAGSIGVELTLPLYAGGAVSSQVREGAALLTKAEFELEAAQRQAALAARQAYLNVTSGLARIRALEAALASSLKNLEATQKGFEVGVRINLDVLNAQAQVADARTQLAKARFDTLLAQLQLKAAVGRLSDEEVASIEALFEPEPR